jgi:hypothetical protein
MPEGEPHGVITFTQCEDELSIFNLDIDNIVYTPKPLKKGKNAEIHLAGKLQKPVHVDHYQVSAFLNGHRVMSKSMAPDVSDFKSEWGWDMSYKIPGIAPPGHYRIKVQAMGALTGQTGNSIIGCGVGDFHF